jgi:hypothetical protein
MATILQAVRQIGSRLEFKPAAQLDKLAEWMAMRTRLNKSEAMVVFQESNGDCVVIWAMILLPIHFSVWNIPASFSHHGSLPAIVCSNSNSRSAL